MCSSPTPDEAQSSAGKASPVTVGRWGLWFKFDNGDIFIVPYLPVELKTKQDHMRETPGLGSYQLSRVWAKVREGRAFVAHLAFPLPRAASVRRTPRWTWTTTAAEPSSESCSI